MKMLRFIVFNVSEKARLCSVVFDNGLSFLKYSKRGGCAQKRCLHSSPCLSQQLAPQACPAPAHIKQASPPSAEAIREHALQWEAALPFKKIPGPNPLPIIGNTWRFLPKIGKYENMGLQEIFEAIHSEYGNIVRMEGIVGRQDSVYLFNPSDVEKIYKIEGTIPERDILPSMSHFRATRRQDIFKDAKGLLTSQGQEWYDFRNKVNTIMMQPKMVKQYVHPVDKIARELVKRIKRIRDDNNKLNVDFMLEVNKWSLESIATLALDTRLGCLADDLRPDSMPQKMIDTTAEVFTYGGKLDFQPSLWRYFATPTYRKAMAAYEEQVNLAYQHIEAAMERLRSEKEAGVVKQGEPSVLEKLLAIDPKVAVVMATDMMLAGIDTTSTALVNVLYHLATNHSKQEVLRGEIISQLPLKTSKLTAEHLSRMPYLRACMKEASRLYPVTPGTMRILTKDTVLRGYQLPKGMNVLFPHMYLSVREDQFPRSTEYLPERWLREHGDSDLSYKSSHPFSHSHFGYGARSCIGRRFAELEMEVAIINFLRNFNLTWDGPPPSRTTDSINHLKGPYHFVFKNNDIEIQGDIACIKNND